jgi:hypothetical protein
MYCSSYIISGDQIEVYERGRVYGGRGGGRELNTEFSGET